MTSFRTATGRCGLLANKAKFLFFAKFQNRTMKLFAALLFFLFHRSPHILFHLFPCKSVNHVKNQSKQQTFIYSLSLLPRFRFRTGVPILSLAMYPFNISIDEHVPLKFLITKRLRKITKIYLQISMILKIIFTDECINISKWYSLYVNIFFP